MNIDLPGAPARRLHAEFVEDKQGTKLRLRAESAERGDELAAELPVAIEARDRFRRYAGAINAVNDGRNQEASAAVEARVAAAQAAHPDPVMAARARLLGDEY